MKMRGAPLPETNHVAKGISVSMEKLRVVAADDHPGLLENVAELLTESGFQVVATAPDGRQAIEVALASHVDLVLLDIWMPVLNGLQAASHLKRRGFKGKVILLTAYDDADLLDAGFAAGVNAFVPKTSLGSDLIPAIRRAFAMDA